MSRGESETPKRTKRGRGVPTDSTTGFHPGGGGSIPSARSELPPAQDCDPTKQFVFPEQKPDATPARGTAQRDVSDEGIKRCLDLMTSGKWIRGKSHVDVAAEFDRSPATVKDWATAASRLIRMATDEEREDIRARMLATLDVVVQKGFDRQGCAVSPKSGEAHFYDNPDLRSVVGAVAEQGKLLGLVVHHHKVDVNEQQIAALPPAAMLAKIREQRARLDEAEVKLLADHPELAKGAA